MPDDSLFHLPRKVQTRWASMENPDAARGAGGQSNKGRKGSPCRRNFQPGETLTLAHAEGRGTVRRFWITIDQRAPEMLRGLLLRCYWDGAAKPAVEVPLGDFCCMPLGQMATFENAWFDTGEGRSFNCRLPMPFRKGFRMTVTNETPTPLGLFFYDVNWTAGDDHDDHTGYFHAHYRRENPTTLRRDFEILPYLQGRGRYLGANMGVIADQERYHKTWWGEGEVKVYLDGDKDLPTLNGTGTEDYIATGWGQGQYARQWHGCPVADGERMRYSFYRLHGPDPIYFQRDIRVTIQQLGGANSKELADAMERGGMKEIPVAPDGGRIWSVEQLRALEKPRFFEFERQDDWSATAYFYLDRPISNLPDVQPYAERVRGLVAPPKE